MDWSGTFSKGNKMKVNVKGVHAALFNRITMLVLFTAFSYQGRAASIEAEVQEFARAISQMLGEKSPDGVTFLRATANGKKLDVSVRKEGDVAGWKAKATRETCEFPNLRRILIAGGTVVYRTEGPDPRLPMSVSVTAGDCISVGLPISPGEPLPEPIAMQRPSSTEQANSPAPVRAPAPPPSAIPRW